MFGALRLVAVCVSRSRLDRIKICYACLARAIARTMTFSYNRRQLLLLCLVQLMRNVSSRNWMNEIDPKILQNDGMPRVRIKAEMETTNRSGKNKNDAQYVTIEIHGYTTTLFEEMDPFQFRVTDVPSNVPSNSPTLRPSDSPSDSFTGHPSVSPSLTMPTSAPVFSVAAVPVNPNSGYFNYDPYSKYGPDRWRNIQIIEKNDPGYFWHNGDDKMVLNECGKIKKQSPIDVCRTPKDECTETHEMRPLPGDYKMDSILINKQILPNKLRLIFAPRTGEEPDPPQIDFSSTGQGLLDMTNIDFKFPSEHTVCGQRFDGEMQYYVYNPSKKRFLAVSFLLDANESNPKNEHLQDVIDALIPVYKNDERQCKERQDMLSSTNSSSSLAAIINDFVHKGGRRELLEIVEDRDVSKMRLGQRGLATKWHPFHPDIQRTIHFWGYSGSITEPPCTSMVDWRVMDVPTPISMLQLDQFKYILMNHVDGYCRQTSVHNNEGSVARPTQYEQDYYKCTRDDYVSDEEAIICGLEGCKTPFGSGLNPYYPPLVGP